MDDGYGLPSRCQSNASRGSGLYVDVENLHSSGQTVIQGLVENWPGKIPPPSHLTLYVQADQAELWRLWAVNRFSDLEVMVKGTQHFSMTSTKNSADIAIATNAMADLILGRVDHVAVLSDDSDFISLYAAIRDDPHISLVDGKVPFLWVVTDRVGSLSTTIKQFFPPDQLHTVAVIPSGRQNAQASESSSSVWEEMAREVARDIQVGSFKSTDCQPVIRKNWPSHPMASAGGPAFGIEFKNNVWPILEGWGVKIRNPGKKPVQYEMTHGVKNAMGQSEG